MNSLPELITVPDELPGNLLVLALLAPVVGAVSGLLGAIFRLMLVHADRLRDALIYWAHTQNVFGFLTITSGCAATTAIAAWLVRRFYLPHPGAVYLRLKLN